MNGPEALRALLARGELVVAPFAYDGLQARLAVRAGFPAVYVTGFGTAAGYGLPDVGLLGAAEMAANVARVAAAVDVPVLADADTGFGSPLNVGRTVQAYARAGAAALHIEDQVWPKRCGFMAGKEVIPTAEMVQKVRAAVDASAGEGPVVIARTDALAVNGWEDVEDRCRRYREAGAEVLFVDGIRSRRDADAYAARLGDLPLLYNGVLPVDEVAARGFAVMLAAGPLLAGFGALAKIYGELAATGQVAIEQPGELFNQVNAVLGLDEVEAARLRYAID